MTVCSFVIAAVAISGLAAPQSPDSPGGVRFAAWRETIDSARQALEQGRPGEAEELYARVVEETEPAAGRTLISALAIDGLADTYRQTGRCGAALELYRRSAALFRELLGPMQPRLAVTLHNLGLASLEAGEGAEAASSLRGALEIWDATFGHDSEQAQNTRRALAKLDAR